MREGIEVEVTAADRARLEAIVAARNSPQKHVWRARIILATGEGCGTAEVMRRAGVSKPCVWRWQERFMAEGVDGLLHDKTRPARIPPLPKAVVETVVARTLSEPPPDGVTHWTAPALAATSGLSVSSVQRIWRSHGLRPHQVRSFKLSSDPNFAAKVEDIRRPMPWCCRSTKRAMCGWLPARKRKVDVWRDGLLAVMCPACPTRSSHDRWPRWVPRAGASSDPRDGSPSTSPGFSQSVGATDHSITFLPSQASRGSQSWGYAGAACR